MKSKSLLALALAMCLSAAGHAEEVAVEATKPLQSLWVTSGFWSYHQAHRDYYNQDNKGIGFEAAFNDNWSLALGRYRNSVREHSRYVQAVWTPDVAQVRFGELRVTGGIAFGLVDGYPDMRQGKFFPALLPVASLEYGRVGLNVTYIPTIAGRVDGAVAVQLKVKAWEF